MPITWIGALLVIVTAALLGPEAVGRSGALVPVCLLCGYLGLAVLVTSLRMVQGIQSVAMPAHATTGLGVFVLLRFVAVVHFIAAIIVGSAYCRTRRDGETAVARHAASALIVVSCYALYVYYAQLAGLPELPRTRIGTDGVAQFTEFQSALHRAMGSFREPSHLAEWLFAPLVVVLVVSGNVVAALLGGITTALTLSLAGVTALAVALVTAIVSLVIGRHRATARIVARILATILIASGLVTLAAQSYSGARGSVLSNLVERARPVIEARGLQGSNRAEIIQAAASLPLTVAGRGLGLANLELSSLLGWPIPASFLSVYRSTAHATGLIGLTLVVAAVVAWPLMVSTKVAVRGRLGAAAAGCVVAWMLLHGVRAEELSPAAGFCIGVLGGLRSGRRSSSA